MRCHRVGLRVMCAVVAFAAIGRAQGGRVTSYRLETSAADRAAVRERFTGPQLEILEKLNRADVDHFGELPQLVVPEVWSRDELAYSVLPHQYPSAISFSKLLVVYLPGQIFGAYEKGTMVRWGPTSSGGRARPTPAGLFSLNWKAEEHVSTVDSDWFMRWYFNFENREGLALHQYELPGLPASHGCIRLLERDATWLFEWGDEWMLDRQRVQWGGTPVLIIGAYDFRAQPPWRSLEWLRQVVELPTCCSATAWSRTSRPRVGTR